MYRNNTNCGSSPRDRMDPRMFRTDTMRSCGCGRCGSENDADEACAINNDAACFNDSLAMVYAPEQEWQNLFEEEEGFKYGTIFKELNKPFYGSKCMAGGCNGR